MEESCGATSAFWLRFASGLELLPALPLGSFDFQVELAVQAVLGVQLEALPRIAMRNTQYTGRTVS